MSEKTDIAATAEDRSPDELNNLHVTEPMKVAAGMKAVTTTMKFAFGEMGVVRGTRALLALNQKVGIDCQSCGWPDPDGKRTIAEFCENGAKALSDEATTKRITAGGFYLPNPPREGTFPTRSGKAEFRASKLEKIEVQEGQLLLATIRSRDQFNTVIYGHTDRYRGIHNERRVVFLNPDDIDKQGLKPGQVVDLTSHFDDGERHVYRFIVVPIRYQKAAPPHITPRPIHSFRSEASPKEAGSQRRSRSSFPSSRVMNSRATLSTII